MSNPWVWIAGMLGAAIVPAVVVWLSTRHKTQADTAGTLIERQEAMFQQLSEFDEQRVAYWKARWEDCHSEHSKCERLLEEMRLEVAKLRAHEVDGV